LQILNALPTADHWREQGGTYHYCDATVTTWHDFARSIFNIASELGVLPRAPGLKAIASKDFPQAATRPMFSVLNTRKVLEQFGVMAPSLDESLRLCLADYRE
jgi:dTDP-4-dehydrorhamnose reductase